MPDEARAKAVEAAEDAFYVAVGLECASRSVAGKAAFGAAITAYLAAMAKAGWVMVPREPTQDMMRAGQAAQRDTPLSMRATFASSRDCYRAMIRAAMLKGDGDEQG